MKLLRYGAVFLAAALLAGTLSACGKKGGDEEEAPEETMAVYEMDGWQVVAFGAEDGLQPEKEELSYTYSGLETAQATLKQYVSVLTGAEQGFFVVNEAFVKSDLPDFEKEEGSVFLAKELPAPEEDSEEKDKDKDKKDKKDKDKDGETEDGEAGDGETGDAEEQPEGGEAAADHLLATLRAEWDSAACTITLAVRPGEISDPPPPPPGMNMAEVVEYVKAISPNTFGLSGTDMEAYNFYIMDGITFVNDQPCMKLKIYDANTPDGTNHYLGIYFLSSDGQRMYRLDQETGTVKEVPISMAAR